MLQLIGLFDTSSAVSVYSTVRNRTWFIRKAEIAGTSLHIRQRWKTDVLALSEWHMDALHGENFATGALVELLRTWPMWSIRTSSWLIHTMLGPNPHTEVLQAAAAKEMLDRKIGDKDNGPTEVVCRTRKPIEFSWFRFSPRIHLHSSKELIKVLLRLWRWSLFSSHPCRRVIREALHHSY